MKLVLPTEYCPRRRTIGFASKSDGERGGEWKWPYLELISNGSIFFRYILLSPWKIRSLSNVSSSSSGVLPPAVDSGGCCCCCCCLYCVVCARGVRGGGCLETGC